MAGPLFLFLWGEQFSAWLISLPPARPLGVVIFNLRLVLLSSVKNLWVAGLTVAVQAVVVLSAYFFALALRVEFGMVQLLMLPLIIAANWQDSVQHPAKLIKAL